MSRLTALLTEDKNTGCMNSVYQQAFFVSTNQCIRTAVCDNCPAHFEVDVIADSIKLIEE